MGRFQPHATQQGAWRLSDQNRTSVSCCCPLGMLTICPGSIRLRRPVFGAVTFPYFAQPVIDQPLGMPAVMGFSSDTAGEVRCVYHAGKGSPPTGSWRGLYRVHYAGMGLRRIHASRPRADPNSQAAGGMGITSISPTVCTYVPVVLKLLEKLPSNASSRET